MKKIMCYVCAAVLLAATGCSGKATLNTRAQLPDDGIVGKSEFERIAGRNVISVLYAADGSYEWTFLGTRIDDPKDADLSLTLSTDLGDGYQLAFGNYLAFDLPSPEALPGTPSLTVRAQNWENGVRYLYQIDDGIPVYRKAVRCTDGRCSFSLENLNAGAAVLSDVVPADLGDEFESEYRDPDQIPEDSALTPMVTISIGCQTALDNWDSLKPEVKDHRIVPADGVILPTTEVYVSRGDSVYDVLVAVTKDVLQMESVTTPLYNAVYIKSINNLYEFDGGGLSGWMFCVNGWYPNYGCSRYKLRDGDKIQWNYTCDLGRDLGEDWLA